MSGTLRQPTVFLTGASSGIGRALAVRLLAEGYAVWGTARQVERLSGVEGLHALELDFAVAGSLEAAWRRAVAEAGEIDIVIQNAGSGVFGAFEEIPAEAARGQWRVLVEGPQELLRLAAGHLRPRGRGWIIGIGSLAAELPMPFFSHYNAGKAALSALLGTLWMELRPFGVEVVEVRPGDIRTGFNRVVPKFLSAASPYHPWASKAWEASDRLIGGAPDPERVAEAVVRLLRRRKTSALERCGAFFQVVAGTWGARLLPRRVLLGAIRRYYGLNLRA